jgi:hypothetical protein
VHVDRCPAQLTPAEGKSEEIFTAALADEASTYYVSPDTVRFAQSAADNGDLVFTCASVDGVP